MPQGRVPAGEIEAAVVGQLPAVFRRPEIVAGTWRAARGQSHDITETQVADSLQHLDPLWEELFPAEQARIVQLLVERVGIGEAGINVMICIDRPDRSCPRHGNQGGAGGMTAALPTALLVQVPSRIRKQGGRKEIILPEDGALPRIRVDNTAVKALARAFRWKRMLDSGAFATIGDLAAHEKIAPSYMTRVMRMTLLAPEIVEGIVEGRIAPGLAELLEPFPVEWVGQMAGFR